MKCLIASILFGIHLVSQAAHQTPPIDFDLQAITVANAIQLIYADVLKTSYVISPEVLLDTRPISFQFKSTKGNGQTFIHTLLSSLGYEINREAGVDFIGKRSAEQPKRDFQTFVYRPQFRDVTYLANLLSPIFKGSFSVNRGIHQANPTKSKKPIPDRSAAALIDQNADVLLFSGEPAEINHLQNLLLQVDQAIGEVVVRGLVYEVSHSENTGSAFGLLTTALRGSLSLQLGTSTKLSNYIQLKNTALEAIYSAVANDSRFRVISSPTLRIQSGAHGSFSVGQDVPVLGAISFAHGSGQVMQSVEYRSSGVIFDVQPIVRDAVIDLEIHQQLSNFIRTTTGVNDSPTLTKRELKTFAGIQDGDVIVLGGLTERKDSQSQDGLSFLPRFFDTKGNEHSNNEILLILQVTKL